MRTTLDIEKPVLRDLKKLAREKRRSMSRVASDLLAESLRRSESPPTQSTFSWNSRRMSARVDIDDKETVYSILDAEGDHQ
ncbi:MAG: antitoxin [Lentisphaeria bacterium]|nr:antitoxin [Lentisphaeria bacterium]